MPTWLRRSWLPDAVALIVVVALLVYLWLRFAHLFPEVEFIDWISDPLRQTVADGLTAIATFGRDGRSQEDVSLIARQVTLIWSSVTGRACGTDVFCINTLAFLPIAATALSLYALARLLALSATAAAAVVAVLLLSEPTFHVLSWQATMHDRWAGMGTFATLLLVVVAVRRARSEWRFVLPWAAGLSLVALFAVNTKEPAWVLIPLVAVAPLALAEDRERRRAAALTLAAPVLVMVVRAATAYVALNTNDEVSSHIGGGSAADVLPKLTDYAIVGGVPVAIIVALASAAAIGLAVRRRLAVPDAGAAAKVAAWMWLGVAIEWAIPARTEFPSPFYMFLPLAIAALATALALRAATLALRDLHTPLAHRAPVAVGTLLVAWSVIGATSERWDLYGNYWVNLDQDFRGAVGRAAELRRSQPDAPVQFYAPPELYSAYRFVTSYPAANFWDFVGADQAVDKRYDVTSGKATCGGAGGFVIVLDSRMRPTGICPGG